jgi:hypothetical protein
VAVQGTVPVGVGPDVDDQTVVHGEYRAEVSGWCGAGAVGGAGEGDVEDHGAAINVDAVECGGGAVGEGLAEPVEDFGFGVAQAGPPDVGVQQRCKQVEVAVLAGGGEVPGDVGQGGVVQAIVTLLQLRQRGRERAVSALPDCGPRMNDQDH